MRFAQSEWQARINTDDFHREVHFGLRSDGFVIFDRVLEESLVERLRKALLERIDDYVDTVAGGRRQNRYHLPLRLTEPFIDDSVITNPLVMTTLARTLGDDLAISYFGSDTAGPGSTYQVVHSDGSALFPEIPVYLATYGVVVNFPLVDFNEDNGPLEIWPNGTHHLAGIEPEAGAAIAGGTPVVAPAGSLIMRDLRLWHRGTPNRTTELRPMVAVVYSRPWYRFGPAEVGYPEPRIGRDDYDHWSPDVRKLFRFATRDDREDYSGEAGLGMVADRKQDPLVKERSDERNAVTQQLSTTTTTR